MNWPKREEIQRGGVLQSLDELVSLHDPSKFDARVKPATKKRGGSKQAEESQLEGMWVSLSKPKFFDCLGCNQDGDFLYSLGRMSFDMFRPTKLVCSIQGTFNPVHVVRSKDRAKIIETAPKSLKKELQKGEGVLRTYQIVTAFSIEPWAPDMGLKSPNKRVDHQIRALLTTDSYVLANPEKPNRLSIWFTGGSIEVNNIDCDDSQVWHQIFTEAPKRDLVEKLRVAAAKLAMGATIPEKMEQDGKMSYSLKRPIGGHDTASVDLLYLDDTIRIARSNTGSVHVMARVPYFPDE